MCNVRLKKQFFFLVMINAISLIALSQSLPVKYLKMEPLTIHDGLSQGMINCITQDHFGFMWFGTNDGLNRYDGYHFTLYRHESDDPHSVSGNLITSILEDSKGRLWVGTGLNGLNLFDRATEQFIRIQNNSNDKRSLSDNRIFSLQEDKHGNIWVGSAYGLNKIIVQQKNSSGGSPVESFYHFEVHRIMLNPSDPKKESFTYHDETGNTDYFEPTFFIDSKGFAWVATAESLIKIKPGYDKIDQMQTLNVSDYIPDNTPFSSHCNHIYNYIEDTAQHLLYLTRKGYVSIVNQETGKVTHVKCGEKDLAFCRVKMLLHGGNIWSASSDGLFEFDLLHQNTVNLLPKKIDDLKTIRFTNTLFIDRTGMIWIGTKGYGILKYNPQTEKFHEVNVPSIIWMSATPDNDIIIQSQKLFLFKRQQSKVEYTIDNNFFNKIYELNKRIPDLAVQNRAGKYFINKSVLYEMQPEKNEARAVPGHFQGCFPLFIDDDDNLWFGGSNSFCKLDKKTQQVREYAYPLPMITMFPYKFLETIIQDRDKSFWLGTINGLFHFEEKNRQWKRYCNVPGDNTSLNVDIIFSVCNDPAYPEKYLWVGTNGGGLNCFNKETEKFIQFTEKEGLPNKVVYGVVNDDDGNLWLSSNKGLSRFTPYYSKTNGKKFPAISGGIFKNFEEEDGLQSNEFNRYAFTRTSDGILFFGGVNGLNYFDPKEIKDNNIVPNVVITDFRINNNPVSFSSGYSNDQHASPLTKPVFLTDKMVLPYRNNISFEFSSMDFTAPEKNLFKYKLEGFDKEWIQSGTNHIATYTNLDPGHYVFHLAGSNNDGVWNENGTSVHLTILPPWYMTWWFRFVVIAVISAGLYALWRYRLRQAIKLMEVRNRIASDLHDEIGSTLSSVYIYSEVAQKTADEKLPEAKTYMKQISVDVAGMIDSLSDIVWTVNAKNDRFENIINRMRATAIELFEARAYQLHLDMDDELNTLKLGMEARKNFYLFYKEAINNTAKYADGKNVFIRLGFEKRNIILSVKDDGIGFDIKQKTNGNGLYNLKKRSIELKGNVEILSSPGSGTEIKLIFPYN